MKLLMILCFSWLTGFLMDENKNQVEIKRTWQKPNDFRLFHNNFYVEKWDPAYKKMPFYMIATLNKTSVLQKTPIHFKEVEDECVGQKITYFKIPGNDDPTIPILVSNSLSEKSKLLTVAFSKTTFTSLEMRSLFQWKNAPVELFVQKNKGATDSADLCIRMGKKVQTLTAINLETDFPSTVIFAGDCTGDQQLDLILQINNEKGIYWILYASSPESDTTPAFKEIARCLYTATPC